MTRFYMILMMIMAAADRRQERKLAAGIIKMQVKEIGENESPDR